jgi:hypothetical protein
VAIERTAQKKPVKKNLGICYYCEETCDKESEKLEVEGAQKN